LSLEVIRGCGEASESLRFESEGREQVYAWLEPVLPQPDTRSTADDLTGPDSDGIQERDTREPQRYR